MDQGAACHGGLAVISGINLAAPTGAPLVAVALKVDPR